MQNLKINGRNWKVAFFDPNNYTEDDGVPLGLTKYNDQMIFINQTLNSEGLYNTLKHEITHAYRWSYGFVIDTHDTSFSMAEVEEMIANFIEALGEQVIEASRDMYKKLEKEKNGKKI